MKQILSAVLFISMIFFSCQKERIFTNGGVNESQTAARRSGGGKPRPPVANAGPDQTITLPANTVALNGSASTDPNNNISSYLWTKVSGPSSFTIANPNSVQTQVTNLVEGAYQFELKVTDARGMTGRDMVQVTVLNSSEPSPPPCTTCKIVFVSARDGNNEIYTSNTDGSNITRLTTDPGNDGQPKWSPDGTRIAFTSDRDGYPGLYIMNADGSNVVQRTFSVDQDDGILGLTWSPDGTKIAYSDLAYYDEYYGFEVTGLYEVSATSGSPLLLFGGGIGGGMHPAWSPDGTRIALAAVRFVNRLEYTFDIYTINANGTSFTPLTVGINTGYDIFNYPSWSPNGAKLAMMFNSQVGVMNSDGSGFTLLMSGEAWAGTSWSSDGAAIVYTSLSGSMYNVSWVAADGSAGGTIVTNGWDADWQR
ncbi:MAG TPA: PKD domain-containing protein [Chitinophagaceae bacterium]|nr:PKD domain-containing protein [Chitinophagaceae bacterium]